MNRVTRSDHPKSVGAERVFLTAEWRHLAMLNYEVDAELLLVWCSYARWFRAGRLHSLPAGSTTRIMLLSPWRTRFAPLAIMV